MGNTSFCDSCGRNNHGKVWWEIRAILHDDAKFSKENKYHDISMDICQNCVVAQKFLKVFKRTK